MTFQGFRWGSNSKLTPLILLLIMVDMNDLCTIETVGFVLRLVLQRLPAHKFETAFFQLLTAWIQDGPLSNEDLHKLKVNLIKALGPVPGWIPCKTCVGWSYCDSCNQNSITTRVHFILFNSQSYYSLQLSNNDKVISPSSSVCRRKTLWQYTLTASCNEPLSRLQLQTPIQLPRLWSSASRAS